MLGEAARKGTVAPWHMLPAPVDRLAGGFPSSRISTESKISIEPTRVPQHRCQDTPLRRCWTVSILATSIAAFQKKSIAT
jgi:hypothetical protein